MPLRIRSHITYPPPDPEEQKAPEPVEEIKFHRPFKRWEEKEKMIVRRYYKELGSHKTAEMLPGRTYRDVQNCARVIGVSGYSK